MTIPLQSGIVYRPVRSRRLGRSLGINILPDTGKVCNFNCPYCQYGWTPAGASGGAGGDVPWPSPDAVQQAVDDALARGASVDRLTLAGNGEPTLHPEFGAIVDRLRAVRDRRAPAARIAILSNASTVSQPSVAAALGRVDERYMKLDAGDDTTLRRLNGSPVPVGEIVEGLQRLGGVVLQSMFTRDPRGKIDNTTEAALAAWLTAVRRVNPLAVHVYTIDREPAWKPLAKVPRETLDAIAARVRAAGLAAVVF